MLQPLRPEMMPPKVSAPPFSPSEIRGSVTVNPDASFWRRAFLFAGPGLLVSVGYMDPGNWATDIESGSRFGYSLLFIVLFSSLSAIVLQCLSARLGIATGKDLARLSSEQYSKPVRYFLWAMAELAIIACDLAEVLGGALAFHLLLGVPLLVGVLLTILDTIIILGLKGRKVRTLEAMMLGLVATVGICFFVELVLIKPYWPDVMNGLVPSAHLFFTDLHALPLAIGIIGATVMPHNLYLHSSIVQTRVLANSDKARQQAVRMSSLDTTVALFFAFFINAAILILAGAAFHTGGALVTEIQDAHRLLEPIVGTAAAGLLFAIALLASGQSSTLTGTIAGQIILEGFLNLQIAPWLRKLITRSLALLPAFIGVWMMGEAGIGRMIVISQIVLSLQLPFAMYPLIRFSGKRKLMGKLKPSLTLLIVSWLIFAIITAGNIWMLVNFAGWL